MMATLGKENHVRQRPATIITLTVLLLGVPMLALAQIPASLILNPTSVTGGHSSTGMVSLSFLAPAGGRVVQLKSSNTAVATVPESVTVAPGKTTTGFAPTTVPVVQSTAVTITATAGAVTKTAQLTVFTSQPPPPQLHTTITGTTTMGNFSSGTWDIVVQNNGGPASRVHVQVSAAGGVIDFHSLSLVAGQGFTCQVTQGVAASGQLMSRCDSDSFGGGKAVTLRLRGGTTVVLDPKPKTRNIEVFVFRDYPDRPSWSSHDSITVTIN